MRSRVTQLIQDFNALNEVEQKVFLDQVDPQPETGAPVKKTRKKRTRSAHAESLSAAIAKTAKADADPGPNCGICGQPQNHSDHDLTYLSSHQFEAPKSVASAARRSSRKGAGASSTPNIEAETESALSASSGGD